MSSTSSILAPPSASDAAEQIYFTHCARSDSVQDQDGYGVRASSTDDPAALELALALPAHEIPLDAWPLDLLPHQAPRRLALARLPDGRAALVHSAYLRQDTRGRPRSYFTHVLLYPRLGLLDAVRAWGSPDWRTSYPAGATQTLDRLAGVPTPGPLDDGALAAFLAPDGTPSLDQTLGGVTFPKRWQGDPERRREVARRALAGVLRILADEGSRLFVLAEPGVVALLLYAAARLLPERLTEGLTFSTYESPDGSLWDRAPGRIVGTWNASESPLPDEQLRRHGYAIDAFTTGPPALDVPPIVDVLLDLAAGRDAAALTELHALWERDEQLSALNLGDVIRVRPARQNVLAGRTTRDDLLTLADCSLGRALLRELEEEIWPLLRVLSARDDVSRQACAATIRRHRAELEAELLDSLGRGDLTDWLARWQVVKSLLANNEGQATFVPPLDRSEVGLPFSWRLALLREWHALDADLLPRHARLLTPRSAEELNLVRSATLPQAWQAQALWLALPALAPVVIRCLRDGGKELLHAFCVAVPDDPAIEDRLGALLPPDDPASCRRYAKLVSHGLTLDAARLERVLARCGADSPAWCEGLWRRANHLITISRLLPPQSVMLVKVWDACCAAIDQRLLQGDAGQLEALKFLRACQKKLGGVVPPGAAQALADWLTLHQQIHRPGRPGQVPATELEQACRRRLIASRAALLANVFGPSLASGGEVPAKTLRRIARSVLGFFHPDEDAAFAALLDLAAQAPAARQPAYQLLFLRSMSEGSRPALLVRHRARLRLSRAATSELLQQRAGWWVAALAASAFVVGGVLGFLLGWWLAR